MAEVYGELDVLEGPEVEIGPDDEDDIDLETSDGETDIHLIMAGSDEIEEPIMGAGPNQDIYEVDQILDGPRKRREHNYQKCYKIRWKHFGKEADSWQPVSDLENVMYMVHEFDHKRAEQQKKRRAMKEQMEAGNANTLAENNNVPEPSTLERDSCDGEESEVYGKLKDRFWKKLEMGLYDETVFEGDMYSKVKGSRRAAHADAATNIQKMQQQHNQRSPPGCGLKTSDRDAGRLKQRSKQRKGASAKSPSSTSSTENHVEKFHQLECARRSRKRSSDPFSARGYMSAKRSRRSREQKRPSVSSVTVGIVSLPQSESLLPNGQQDEESGNEAFSNDDIASHSPSNESMDEMRKPPFNKLDSGFGDENEDTYKVETETRMTVSSETMLTVTTESRRLETENVIQPEEIIKLESDANFLPDPRAHVVDDSASAAAEGQTQFSPASGAFSNSSSQRSTLDTLSEATGAVERSHSEECLWGGACNRSDCKSNRRWNMKNGKSQNEEKVSSSSNSTATGALNSPSADNVGSSAADNSFVSRNVVTSANSESSNSRMESSNSPQSGQNSSSFGQTSMKTSTQSHAAYSIQERSVISSSHSSGLPLVADGNTSSHVRRDITSIFENMDCLTHRMHSDIAASSSSRENFVMNSRNPDGKNISQMVAGNVSSHSGDGSRERPGLFSDNSAFSFLNEDSSANRIVSTVTDMSEALVNPSNPSPSGSIHLSSPGKENFSSGGYVKNDRNSIGPSGQEGRSSSMSMEQDSRQEPVSSSSEQPEMMDFINSTDGWSQRKRGSENSQPLEKIPSPNSRRVSDLDQRVLTNTCDELEDMEVQGEDHKDRTLVTNADLLQAVNLNKGEVVRRAIKQSADTVHRLDFEQPDNSGLTLLMRAVQKSSIAIVEMLIENGANVNAQQTNGTSPLMIAVEQREICVVALLLKYGANSSVCTLGSEQGETALIKAIRRQNKDAVSLMLRTGVNFSTPDCTSMSALDVAIERRNTQIEALIRSHIDRMVTAFEERVLETLQDTAQILDKLFPVQCFPLRESQTFAISFNGSLQPLPPGEGFLLFIAHTKINDKGVRCRFHGSCPIASVTLNGVLQSALTKEVNFVTSCHPVISGCNTLEITKQPDYFSKAKLMVCAYHARLLPRM